MRHVQSAGEALVPRASHGPAQEHVQEHLAELLAEDAVHDEVDRRVEGDQEIGDPYQRWHVQFEHLQNVDEQREDVADEEDGHDAHQHRGQSDFFFFASAEPAPVEAGAAHGAPDRHVQHGQGHEGDEVHHEQVQPDVVHLRRDYY